MKWFWIILALVYLVSPYDLLPDFLPIRGWIDDAVVLSLLIWYIRRLMHNRPAPGGQERYRQQGPQSERTTDEGRPHGGTGAADDPYQVLGVSPDASRDEIQRAYRRLAGQYHPDKVAYLGKEFQELAEKRFKEIQAAYEKIAKP